MFEGMYRVTGGLVLEEKRHAVTARNLAGVTVPGYRREYLVSEAFGEAMNGAMGKGSAAPAATQIDWTQGPLRPTGRALDFALSGKGFFAIEIKGGDEVYTRNGAFRVDAQRRLTTQSGNIVLDDRSRPIEFAPDDDIETASVRRDGSIYVRNSTGVRLAAKLRIVEMADMSVVARITASYYAVGRNQQRQVTPATDTVVVSGSLEGANFSAVEEMAQMVQSLREFEANQNVIKSSDDVLRRHIQSI